MNQGLHLCKACSVGGQPEKLAEAELDRQLLLQQGTKKCFARKIIEDRRHPENKSRGLMLYAVHIM